MRVSPSSTTGSVGLSETRAAFEALSWGVAETPAQHDLGTDLWLMARDARGYDLGLLVGAQVKAGPSWFNEPHRDDHGELVGWWFRDSRQHFDYWLEHGTPHLVVLYDRSTHTAYWVHVSADAVVPTGADAKILVPVIQVVDEARRDNLLRAAASRRVDSGWQGSAWTGGNALPPGSLLRHALIVPRLVAPHRNRAPEGPLTATQTLAMLVQGRLAELAHQERHEQLLSAEEALSSSDWDWRLYGAMHRRVTTGAVEPLEDRIGDAPDASRRTAVTVAAAAALLERGLPDDAVDVLQVAICQDDADPVDHAWLSVQLARAFSEIGRLDEARDLAAGAQTARSALAGDLTGTAIAGAGALLLFETSAWLVEDLEAAITGADNIAAWWRTQTGYYGLLAATERTFRDWSRHQAVRLDAQDEAASHLVAAALAASHAGDHGSWRTTAALLGQDGLLRLDRNADPKTVAAGLEELRVSGDIQALEMALVRLVTDGPVDGVRQVAERVDLALSTRTTARTDLALIRHGGDLLSQPRADAAANWLLNTLQDPEAFVVRTVPTFFVDLTLVEALPSVVLAASPDVQRGVAERIVDLAPVTDQVLSLAWARVVEALPARAWVQPEAVAAGAHLDETHMKLARLAVASVALPEARSQLEEEARYGSFQALAALPGEVRDLPQDVVADVIAWLAQEVTRRVEESRPTRYTGWAHDAGHALAILNIWHPDLAAWDPLLRLIADVRVAPSHKRGALQALAALPDQLRLAEPVLGDLQRAALAACHQPAPGWPDFFGSSMSAAGPAAELLKSLQAEGDGDSAFLPTLLTGGPEDRMSVARLAGRRLAAVDIGILLVMAVDLHPGVRAAASRGLLRAATAAPHDQAVRAAVARSLDDPGRQVPAAVADELNRLGLSAAGLLEARRRLQDHASAWVRAREATASDPGL